MCRHGRGRQASSQTDTDSPPHSPEYLLPYVVHSLAHHPSFPSLDESRDVKTFEEMYRYLRLAIVIAKMKFKELKLITCSCNVILEHPDCNLFSLSMAVVYSPITLGCFGLGFLVKQYTSIMAMHLLLYFLRHFRLSDL